MFSLFFIDRPIFSWVVALLISGAGLLALNALPVQQYPEIAAPEVIVIANYPGASAETVDKTVTQIIEQNLRGIDNLRYFSAESSSEGSSVVRLTFEPGTNIDIAQVQTQNKVSETLPRLPSQVQQLGISVEKSSRGYALIPAFYSKNGKINQDDLSDYIASNVIEPVSRVKGVGEINPFSPQHSLRIWLDPERLFHYKLTALEVLTAVRAQNTQLPSGQIGAAPLVEGQQINAGIISKTLMTNPDEFKAIVLRTLPDGSSVTLADVARVEVGAENYASVRRFNGKVAAGFGVTISADANALETIEAVKQTIAQMRPSFPEDVEVSFPVDISPFIEVSINEVMKTLLISIILVVATMYIFLQNWRSTLVPGIAIPIVLLGSFAALAALGYSINILTLFALVLSIGMLVDDAIVVTEQVKRHIDENPDLTSKEAAKQSMLELFGAIVGTTVVIWAVFIPMAFFQGATGVIYRQFSITILASMTISLFIAVSFSPALAGSIIAPTKKKESRFFRWFNKYYDRTAVAYGRIVRWLLQKSIIGLASFVLIFLATAFIYQRIPGAFLPNEDQGRVFVMVDGPPNATFHRMMGTVQDIEKFFMEDVGGAVEGIFSVIGFSFSGRGQNAATAFVSLKEHDKRQGDVTSVFDIAERARALFANFRVAQAMPLTPPPIPELARTQGFEFQLVDLGRIGTDELLRVGHELVGKINGHPHISYVRPNTMEDEPQYKFDIDYKKAQALGVRVEDINSTMSAAWGSAYVNDYVEAGRVKRVFLQGEANYRMDPRDIAKWFVKNQEGEMVSFADFTSGKWVHGPQQLQRFNGFSSLEIQGEAAPGFSTGQAMEAVDALRAELPPGVDLEWTGLSYDEREAGAQVFALYAISIIAIFLSLAALYESWTIPFSIILVLPVGIFGAALFVWAGGLTNDIYFKVGFLLTMGLAAKNAILIVEFAKQEFDRGKSAFDAAVLACQRRFRPVMMTSFTFILGILPLSLAQGPGSGAQNSIGTSMLGGIASTTFLLIFFAPLFFFLVVRLKERLFNKGRQG